MGGRHADGRKPPRRKDGAPSRVGANGADRGGRLPVSRRRLQIFQRVAGRLRPRDLAKIRGLARLSLRGNRALRQGSAQEGPLCHGLRYHGPERRRQFARTRRRRPLCKIWIRRRSPNNIRRSRRKSILPIAGQSTGSPIALARSGASRVSTRPGWETAWRPAPRSRPSQLPALAYHPTSTARTAVAGFKKGSEIYLLDDPKGQTWVMVSYKDMPEVTIDKLKSLGDVLKLPQGWKFRDRHDPQRARA